MSERIRLLFLIPTALICFSASALDDNGKLFDEDEDDAKEEPAPKVEKETEPSKEAVKEKAKGEQGQKKVEKKDIEEEETAAKQEGVSKEEKKEPPKKVKASEKPASPAAKSIPVAKEEEEELEEEIPASPSKKIVTEDDLDAELLALLQTPIVETASRRAQKQNEAPSAVAVITAEQISRSGVETLPELLRRVVGVYVRQLSGRSYDVGARGFIDFGSRRILVLIDGRNVSNEAQGFVNWGSFPVALQDIKQIEVVRGPGSVMFGANALSAVINIITWKGSDKKGLEGEVWAGAVQKKNDDTFGGAASAYAAYNMNLEDERLPSLRLSAGLENIAEYNYYNAEVFPHAGPEVIRGLMRLDYEPIQSLFLQLSGGAVAGEYELVLTTGEPTKMNVFRDYFANLSVKKEGVFTDGSDSFKFATDFTYRDWIQNDAAQGKVTLSSWNYHLALEYNINIFDINTTGVGFEFRQTQAESIYFVGNPKGSYVGGFIYDELKLWEALIFNAALRAEMQKLSDDENSLTNRNLSPRGAVIWNVNNNHTLRAIVATSFRNPTTTDYFFQVSLPDQEVSTPPNETIPPKNYVLRSNSFLKQELYKSAEIGYMGRFASALRLEANFFGGIFNNYVGPAYETRVPVQKQNLYDINQLGAELALFFAPLSWLNGYANYSFVYNHRKNSTHELIPEGLIQDWPQHIAGLGISLDLPHRIRLNGDFFFASASKVDTSEVYKIGDYHINIWETRTLSEQTIFNLRLGYFVVPEKVELYISGRNLINFFRGEDNARQYPHRYASPIGGVVMVGITAREF